MSLILRRPRQRPSRRMVAGLRIAAILRDASLRDALRMRTEIVFWPPRATSTCAPRSSAGEKAASAIRALLLEYLHDSGTVFYREGLFGDQIILDQAWALDAVYAVFDRASQTFRKIERNRGRFWRSDLAELVWQQHGVPEQELFLSFMQQCGICFTSKRRTAKNGSRPNISRPICCPWVPMPRPKTG